jgi:hypothetical protein
MRGKIVRMKNRGSQENKVLATAVLGAAKKILPLCIFVSIGFLNGDRAPAEPLELSDELALAYQNESPKEAQLIRWSEKPKLVLLFSPAVSEVERSRIEKEAEVFADRCHCIASVQSAGRKDNSSVVWSQTALVIVDKYGFSGALAQFQTLISWAYSSDSTMRSALPAEKQIPSTSFRVGMTGAQVVRTLSVISITDDTNSSRAQVLQGFFFSLSPTLSKNVEASMFYFDNRPMGNSVEYFVNDSGFDYLRTLYNDNLRPGMTPEEVQDALY